MRLSVIGLGYVGSVSAACLAREGFEVVGVDINPAKVEMLNNGRSPVVERGLSELIREMVAIGRLRATTDPMDAVEHSEISLVCVGTPSHRNGSLDLTAVERACRALGTALRRKRGRHTVVLRSTMLPGTTRTVVIPALREASGKEIGSDLDVCVNPEFLREGSSLQDFSSPPFTVIGAENRAAAAEVARLYCWLEAPLHLTDLQTAEMVKYACNSFHGLKVCFANEIGNLCKGLGIDGHQVMRLFCQDTKLNLSPYYLKPGFAFGGSCLPKDLRAITHKAKELDLEVPVLAAILQSNRYQFERAVEMVLRTGKKRIGVLGLSFKPGTDDLRESPMVALIETLIGKGMQVAIYDPDVSLARLFGANKAYIEHEIPHIAQLMRSDIGDVLESSEVIIIGKASEEFLGIESQLRTDQTIIGLVRLEEGQSTNGSYDGICW